MKLGISRLGITICTPCFIIRWMAYTFNMFIKCYVYMDSLRFKVQTVQSYSGADQMVLMTGLCNFNHLSIPAITWLRCLTFPTSFLQCKLSGETGKKFEFIIMWGLCWTIQGSPTPGHGLVLSCAIGRWAHARTMVHLCERCTCAPAACANGAVRAHLPLVRNHPFSSPTATSLQSQKGYGLLI